MKKAFKRFLQRFHNATTPKAWKKYRNLAASIATAIGVGYAGATQVGVELPDGWGKGTAAAIGILLAFASFAQAQETPEEKNKPEA